MIEAHQYYFAQQRASATPTWFSFESTQASPAEFGRDGAHWVKNGDIQLGAASAGRCAMDKPDYLPCEAALPRGAACGPASGRLPIMVRARLLLCCLGPGVGVN